MLRYLNRCGEQSLDEASFKKLSLILVAFMIDVRKGCSQDQMFPESRQLPTSEWCRKLTGNKPELSNSMLVDILTQISRNYRFGSLVLDDDGDVLPEQSEVIDFTTNFRVQQYVIFLIHESSFLIYLLVFGVLCQNISLYILYHYGGRTFGSFGVGGIHGHPQFGSLIRPEKNVQS